MPDALTSILYFIKENVQVLINALESYDLIKVIKAERLT